MLGAQFGLWITRGKLWISGSNWGKLDLLCELFLNLAPPYMEGIVGMTLYTSRSIQPVDKPQKVLVFSLQGWGENRLRLAADMASTRHQPLQLTFFFFKIPVIHISPTPTTTTNNLNILLMRNKIYRSQRDMEF